MANTTEVEDNEWESEFEKTPVSPTQYAFYFVVAAFLASAPIQLYWHVYEMSFDSYGVLFVPVTLIAASLLTLSYKNTTQSTFARLSGSRKDSSNHKKLGLSKTALDAIRQEVTSRESIAWSFFVNNLLFFVVFSFLAFYALSASQIAYNYALSMLIASASVYRSSTM